VEGVLVEGGLQSLRCRPSGRKSRTRQVGITIPNGHRRCACRGLPGLAEPAGMGETRRIDVEQEQLARLMQVDGDGREQESLIRTEHGST